MGTRIWMFWSILLIIGLTYLSLTYITNEMCLSFNETSRLCNIGTPKKHYISGISMDVVENVRKVQQELHYSIKTITKLEQDLHHIKKYDTDDNKLSVIVSDSKDFFEQIKGLENCKTVFFSVSKKVFFNVLGKMYAAHSNDCRLFITKSINNQDILDLQCQEGPLYPYVGIQDNNTVQSKLIYKLQTGFLEWNRNTSYDYEKNSNVIDVGFMHVVKNAKLTAYGDFITGNSLIYITQCRKPFRPNFNAAAKLYDKVFSISQYWGENYYHFTNENLPRIVFALQFLLQNEDIKIHTSSQSSFVQVLLAELGINKTRLVSGDIQAKTAYIPGGLACGTSSVTHIKILSMFLRAKLKYEQKRDTIVLIQRSSKRWFKNHNSILKMLESTAEKFHLAVKVFGDRPLPTILESQKLFNRAIMVVGPHGAGISNIIFSQPGTCVIEGLCYDSTNRNNHCYKHLAQVLGHIYHGVVFKKQCMQLEPKDLTLSVDQCLQEAIKFEK